MKLPFEMTFERGIIAALALALIVAVGFGLVRTCQYKNARAQVVSDKLNQDFSVARTIIEKEIVAPELAELTTDETTRAMSNAWEAK